MGSEKSVVELDRATESDGAAAGSPVQSRLSVDPDVRQYFENTVERWDRIYTGSGFINWHLAHRRRLVIDAVRRLSNGRSLRVLDLGCGSGVLTRDLLRMSHFVSAMDCSENMVRALMRSVEGGLRSRFLGAAIGSADTASFASEAFDIIICIGVIQYQRYPRLVFQEISRLLKPGGACVFTVPNQLSLHHLLDPWCAVRYIYRLAVNRYRHRQFHSSSFQAPLDRSAYSTDIYEKRYFQKEISQLVDGLPLLITQTIGFGYGPLTIANKPWIPCRTSIAISKALVTVSHRRSLSWLSTFANRWVVVVEKQC